VMKTIEKAILINLLKNEPYSRKVIPFLKSEYFFDKIEKLVFTSVYDFIIKYNALPTQEAIVIDLDTSKSITEDENREASVLLDGLFSEDIDSSEEWLIEKTENFCKEKAVYNAIMESIHIMDGKSNNEKTENAIPEILSEALSVSFDAHIGHDYIEDSDERFEFYHKVEKKVPFDITFLNNITNGGTPRKTLNIIMAGTGVGKSLFMCHHAASCLSQGLNVLYITCEMAEERIAERIDANLMDIAIGDLKELPKDSYEKKINKIHKNNSGKLIVKEYPTATANASHFRHLLDELKLKKKFIPDIIFVDYLNICASSRMKMSGSVNSYTYIKAIAEELRGLAVERNVPVWSATQVNRTGFTSTDFGLEDTSESFGLPATADFMIALIATEELDELGQVLVKQLKNRYNDVTSNRKFILGINKAKMKLFDLEDSAQVGLLNAKQIPQKENDFDNYPSFLEQKRTEKEKFVNWKV
jgi:replicative DNA helicase